MAVSAAHRQRIKRELSKAGMTAYGQLKMSSRHLPKIIANDEHIHGVVYGWRGGGLAMLVATNERIIYLERRPMFTSVDDLSYDIISGVRFMDAGLFPSINLHTRMGDYQLTYVNPACARQFEAYITSRIERLPGQLAADQSLFGKAPQLNEASDEDDTTNTLPEIRPALPEDAREFLKQYEVGVLSTTNRTGQAAGAAVYYVLASDDCLYIITKSDTTKAHNMLANHYVSFTVFDPTKIKTAQIQGFAEIEADYEKKRHIFEQLIRFRNYGGEILMPPITQLSAGGFIAFKITPVRVAYYDYKHMERTPDTPESAAANS